MESDYSGGVYIAGPPTDAAFRVAEMWPSPETQLERLIDALQTAAKDESRPEEERGRFRQAAAWLGGAASQIAIGAGGNMITG